MYKTKSLVNIKMNVHSQKVLLRKLFTPYKKNKILSIRCRSGLLPVTVLRVRRHDHIHVQRPPHLHRPRRHRHSERLECHVQRHARPGHVPGQTHLLQREHGRVQRGVPVCRGLRGRDGVCRGARVLPAAQRPLPAQDRAHLSAELDVARRVHAARRARAVQGGGVKGHCGLSGERVRRLAAQWVRHFEQAAACAHDQAVLYSGMGDFLFFLAGVN